MTHKLAHRELQLLTAKLTSMLLIAFHYRSIAVINSFFAKALYGLYQLQEHHIEPERIKIAASVNKDGAPFFAVCIERSTLEVPLFYMDFTVEELRSVFKLNKMGTIDHCACPVCGITSSQLAEEFGYNDNAATLGTSGLFSLLIPVESEGVTNTYCYRCFEKYNQKLDCPVPEEWSQL